MVDVAASKEIEPPPPPNESCAGRILGLRPANERRRYFVTTSLIGWAQAWIQPCMCICNSWDILYHVQLLGKTMYL